MRFDAEGRRLLEPCPNCGSTRTITYEYDEGFSELECEACGYLSDQEELNTLNRYEGKLLEEGKGKLPPIPIKRLKA